MNLLLRLNKRTFTSITFINMYLIKKIFHSKWHVIRTYSGTGKGLWNFQAKFLFYCYIHSSSYSKSHNVYSNVISFSQLTRKKMEHLNGDPTYWPEIGVVLETCHLIRILRQIPTISDQFQKKSGSASLSTKWTITNNRVSTTNNKIWSINANTDEWISDFQVNLSNY